MREGYHPHRRRSRAQGAIVILAGFLSILGIAFFRAQFLRSSDYTLRSEMNRLRPLVIPAARGTILDRNGLIVADNVPGWSISLFPAPSDSLRATLERLAPVLAFPEGRIDELMQRAERAPGRPLLITYDGSREQVARLEERRGDFPEVILEMHPKRRYPAAAAVGHLVGYVGEISADELEMERFVSYEQGMIVGKDGLERQYETGLQGEQGVRYVEVDARGRIIGSFLGQEAAPAHPGTDLHLNIDLELQEFIHRIFPDSLSGAVVALDAADGGILALYSHPSFDPNDFVGGIDRATWERLTTDPDRPLYNRAVLGLYAPASTFKTIVGAMGLEAGVIDPDTRMPQGCSGGYWYGNRYWRCWNPAGHGHQNLAGALAHSCNVFFYQLGLQLGLEGFLAQAERLGMNESCGIDLPRESTGQFPEGLDYWQRVHGYRPTEGEVLSLAIGQGPNAQTVLKMAQFYLALARDGSAPAPSLHRGGTGAEGFSMNLSPASLQVLRDGLEAVTSPGGTAYLSSLEYWNLMGKTGSGQALDRTRPYSWFTGMAGPWDGDPEIVLVALMESGQGGSTTAAPVVAKAADFHLRRKHGVPVDSIQTLREHILRGRPAPWAGRRGAGVVLPRDSASLGIEPDAALGTGPIVFPGPLPVEAPIPEGGRPPTEILPMPIPASALPDSTDGA